MSRSGRPESNDTAPSGTRDPLPGRPGRSTKPLSKEEATEALTEAVRTLAPILSRAEIIRTVEQALEPAAGSGPAGSAWERHDDPEMQ